MGALNELEAPLCGFGRAEPLPGRSYLADHDGAPIRVAVRPDLSVYRAVAEAVSIRTGMSYERALIELLKGQRGEALLKGATARSGVIRRIETLGTRAREIFSRSKAR